jgi:HAD superfamily hydrolase (TIGR01509 family)
MNPFQNNQKSIAPLIKTSVLPDFKYVIWDVDGTILDSEPIHQLSVIATCQEAGVQVDGKSVIQFLGKSHFDTHSKIIEHSSYDKPFEEFLTKCTSHYIQNLDKIELRDDVLDVIHMLDSQGVSQSIFSNNPGNIVFPTASAIEDKVGKKDFFEHIVSLDGTCDYKYELPRKPNPEGYIFTLNLLETVAEECIVIEDSPTGTKAGTSAGIYTIGWGHGNENDLQNAGANLVISGKLMRAFDKPNQTKLTI